MRLAVLGLGLVCLLIGVQFLVVDQIVLHEFELEGEGEPGGAATEVEERLVDLPDWAGYVLVAIGIAGTLFFLATDAPPQPKKPA